MTKVNYAQLAGAKTLVILDIVEEDEKKINMIADNTGNYLWFYVLCFMCYQIYQMKN